jgi:hypothetical protein
MATQINLDTSQRVDITCRRGDTFSLRLTLTDSSTPPVASFAQTDVFLMQVRDADTNDEATIMSASPTTPDPTVQSYVDFTIDAVTMKAVASGLYVYDIEQETNPAAVDGVTPASVVTTLIYGTLKVNEDVSITA